MRHITKLFCTLIFTIIGGAAVAQDNPNPAATTIGMDINISAADIDLRVNDVPVFDPDPERPFGTERSISTQIGMNPSFAPGENTIHVRVRMKSDSESGFDNELRVDFGYWSKADRNRPFSGHPMAGGFELSIEQDPGNGPMLVLNSYVGGQPLMTADLARHIEGTGIPTEWNTYELTVNVALDLPEAKWRAAAPLEQSAATRVAVLSELQRAHNGISEGVTGTLAALGPYIERQAAAEGVGAQEFASTVMGFLFDPAGGFAPLPFDVSDAELTFFGGGRLATFVPIPIGFENEETKQRALIFVYYWKDAAGNWQVIH